MQAGLRPERLSTWLDRQDLTLAELVEAADGLLGEVAPVQNRYKVTARPDVRTIRYYTSQGLLPKPVGYDGGRARYAATHLLRLLLIKKLQAEHHTLARIKRQLQGASDQDVVAALTGERAERPTAHQPQADEPRPPIEPELPGDAPPLLPLLELELADAEGALGRLHLSPETLQDPERRARLAVRLEQLASQLKQNGEES
jgi:DNA-binding transcriptional MerR regulator